MSAPVTKEPETQVEPFAPMEPFAPVEEEALTDHSLVDLNKKALEVMTVEGADAAVEHMMTMAGGDYSRMRMMYG